MPTTWLAFKRLLLKLKSYDPVNFDGKGCLGPISATSFYSDSQQGKRHYYLEGKKKSCLPITEQVTFKSQPGKTFGCRIIENIA